jgi:hypothetical protein
VTAFFLGLLAPRGLGSLLYFILLLVWMAAFSCSCYFKKLRFLGLSFIFLAALGDSFYFVCASWVYR